MQTTIKQLKNVIKLVQQYKQFRQECANDKLNTIEDKEIYTTLVKYCDNTLEILNILLLDNENL